MPSSRLVPDKLPHDFMDAVPRNGRHLSTLCPPLIVSGPPIKRGGRLLQIRGLLPLPIQTPASCPLEFVARLRREPGREAQVC
jgi:hypothetical protein